MSVPGQDVKPRLTEKRLRGLEAINRILRRCFVAYPTREDADDVAAAREWIREMTRWQIQRERER